MKAKSILAVGSMALDSVETPFGKVRDALGGSVTYFSASARFFAPVTLVAVIGRDFPERHLVLMRRLGIDTSGIVRETGKTFRWKGLYNFDLNNPKTLKTELNVFRDFKPVLDPEHRQSRFVFLANIDPQIQEAVLDQVEDPLLTACDTMNFWIENNRSGLLRLLRKVDILLCNDSEARELSGETNLVKASQWILSHGPRLAVIKKGEHGVICFAREFMFLTPAYLLESVFDPTGAGDSFAGGFMGFLTRSPRLGQSDVRKAVVYGSILASYNVESFSLKRLVSLRWPEIQERYKIFRDMTRF